MFGNPNARKYAPFVEIFQREDFLWDWHLIASNGRTICGSTQGYESKWDAKVGYNRAMTMLGTDPEVRYKTTAK